MKQNISLICPECKQDLIVNANRLSCPNEHVFYINDSIYNLMPKSVNEIVKGDAIYHEAQKETWIEQNQINSLRNLYYHKKIISFIANKSDNNSNILEVGGGVGFDLDIFLKNKPSFQNYIFSEISLPLSQYVYKKIKDDKITYCCIDAHNIPFKEDQFDFVYMAATFHHFYDVDAALKEIVRVANKGGYIILGIEPNKWAKYIYKMKNILFKILPYKNISPADDKASGLAIGDYKRIGIIYNLNLVKIEPVWLFCGFIHYGLEFIYRLFRLKNRIKLPNIIENIFIHIDNYLALIPGLKNLFWHYTVIYQKNNIKYL